MFKKIIKKFVECASALFFLSICLVIFLAPIAIAHVITVLLGIHDTDVISIFHVAGLFVSFYLFTHPTYPLILDKIKKWLE